MGLLSGIRKNVLVLGVVSFLTDVSSEMIFPILPVFLTSVLGVGTGIVGLIEGVADSASSLLDIFVGYASDTSSRRKTFVMAGYGLSTVSKLGIAFASTWPLFLVFRGVERIGKSVRTSPRDAIIAASSEQGVRGKAFGLHRAMDTLGAVAGPAFAYVILTSLGTAEHGYRTVFYLALIPAFLAVAVIWFFVREPQADAAPKDSGVKKIGFRQKLYMLSADYKRYLYISCAFSLSYFSFALLIVRASQIGVSTQDILLVYILYNIFYLAFSVPAGQVSDKVGRKPVIVASFLVYALVVLGFAFASSLWQVAVLFAIYGIFVAADDSVNKAYISDITDDKSRGIALGAYNTAVGAFYLPSSVIFGALWAAYGAQLAFGLAAAVAAASGIGFAVWAPGRKPEA